MRMIERQTGEIFVSHDEADRSVDLEIEVAGMEGRLSLGVDEARRLAALILFQAARLDRPRAAWGAAPPATERKSA